jgi:hypothetical protein
VGAARALAPHLRRVSPGGGPASYPPGTGAKWAGSRPDGQERFLIMERPCSCAGT